MRRKQIVSPAVFLALLDSHGIERPEVEYRFHPQRRWRADYAWPLHKVMLEVEGGVWTGGRHVTGTGFLSDMEKYNAAAVDGWRLLRCTPSDLLKIGTVKMIELALRG